MTGEGLKLLAGYLGLRLASAVRYHGLAGGDKKLVAEAQRRALDFIRTHLSVDKR